MLEYERVQVRNKLKETEKKLSQVILNKPVVIHFAPQWDVQFAGSSSILVIENRFGQYIFLNN